MPPSSSTSWIAWFREWLAAIIVFISIVAIAILAGIAIRADRNQAREILTMILPMIGTWVGTVLAFYFGKEQLEAATRSLTAIARELTPEEKLRSIKATEKMIPLAAAYVISTDSDDVNLLDAVEGLIKAHIGNRLPILSATERPRYVIHRSTIDRFLTAAAAAGNTAEQLRHLTLADLLRDPEFRTALRSTFGIIPETGTLADAKRVMELLHSCQDVFVTRNGTANEPVTGWLTNAIIEANSRV